MIASKMLVAGGLILTLGAFGPAFAQSSKDSKTSPTSYSEQAQGNNSTAQPASNDQNPNASSDESSAQNDNQTEEQNENSSGQSNGNQNAGAQNEPSQNQTSGNGASNQTSQINTPTPDQLAQQAEQVQRQIHHLDKDLSDAVRYENTAREDWNNKDLTGARTNYRLAEHILSMATGGATFQPAMLGQSAQEREKMAQHAIDREKARGVDVSDAEKCMTKGKDALKRGDQMQASNDFREAELTLGVPVEVGYAEVWETEKPGTASSKAGADGASSSQFQGAAAQQPRGAMSNEQDARTFIDNGEQALNQGHRTEAERDFRAADRALSLNETATSPDSPNSSNSSSTNSANQ